MSAFIETIILLMDPDVGRASKIRDQLKREYKNVTAVCEIMTAEVLLQSFLPNVIVVHAHFGKKWLDYLWDKGYMLVQIVDETHPGIDYLPRIQHDIYEAYPHVLLSILKKVLDEVED